MAAHTVITGDWPLPHPEATWNGRARQLQSCPLFRNVGVAQMRAVLRGTGTRHAGSGGFYFRQGGRADEAYVLVRGRVKLVRASSHMRRGILRFISPMEPFGYEAALGGTGHVVSAQATEDSEALVWPASTLVRIMTSHPVIAHNSLRLMAERIQGKWERISGLLTESLERRVARALLLLGCRIGRKVEGGVAIGLMFTHQDLAAFVGATPYTMSRILSRWRRLRILDAGRGWLVIRPRRLTPIAGGHGGSESDAQRGKS